MVSLMLQIPWHGKREEAELKGEVAALGGLVVAQPW